MESTFSIEDILAIIRRRWLLFVGVVIPVTILAALVAFALPKTYESTARILVESQQIPQDLARSTVTASPNERIRLIEQRLMTRRNLLELAERHEIFADRPGMSPTDIVDAMRDATSIEVIALAMQGRGEVSASAFNISFQASNPRLTAEVANDFLSQIIEQNVRQRSARASNTLEFFTEEVERLGRELTLIDERISNYKNANENALPDSLEFRRSELVNLEERMFERERQRVMLAEQRTQLELIQRNGGFLAGPAQNLSPAEQELGRLRQNLVSQRAVLAESHPSIRALVARIAALESTIDGGQTDDSGASGSDSVARRSQEIDRQIRQIDVQLEQLAAQREVDEARLQDLRQSIERTPDVEAVLNAMLRQQANLQVQYQEAVQKQADAAVGERLEVNQQAERFEVIEQPQVPSEPKSPNRPLVVAGGAGVGAILGAGLVLLIELLFPRIYSARDLERFAGLRPISVVGYIATAKERRVRKRSRLLIVGLTIAAVLAALYAVDMFVMPLPVLLERLAVLLRVDTLISTVSSMLGI